MRRSPVAQPPTRTTSRCCRSPRPTGSLPRCRNCRWWADQGCRFRPTVFVVFTGSAQPAAHESRRTPMRYLLLIYETERMTQPSADEASASTKRYAAFTAEVRQRGLFQAGEALEPTTTAT